MEYFIIVLLFYLPCVLSAAHCQHNVLKAWNPQIMHTHTVTAVAVCQPALHNSDKIRTKEPTGSDCCLHMTSTYIFIFPATLPTVHRFSRTDRNVNFGKRNKKNSEADFQYRACVVIRYYCEPINQLRKHGKYPVPVFVPERATGLRNINTECVCAPICVRIYEGFIPLSIMFVLPCLCACYCLCACVCADACWYVCVLVCEHKQSWMIIP